MILFWYALILKMSSLGLNSTKNYPSVNILPAQRAIVLADSKYRRRNKEKDSEGNIIQVESETESPYNFQANFSSALVGRQIIYQKLYWNQPIYSHNNDSCELRFQINGDDSVTYVIYAVPFVMYNQYDGNPPGIPWPPPQPFSYASMMELGFNGDVRLLNSNMQLTIPPPPATDYGWLYDANGFQMTVYFRYSPAQGFSISFAPSINPAIPVYSIRLLPCSYIAKAHFVHGFGIFDETSGLTDFVPRNQWTVAYFADDTPNLLPFRYITIRSAELTKDRRMISFQNANANRFGNEISIIALSPVYTGTYHTENVGDDATVISKRDDYQPSTVRIIIADETGAPIKCDSPISNLMQTPDIVNDFTKNSFVSGSKAGRGNVDFVNAIVFGVQEGDVVPIYTPTPVETIQSSVASPLGTIGYTSPLYNIAPYVGSQKNMSSNFWTWLYSATTSSATYLNMRHQSIPIIVTPTGGSSQFPPSPDSYTYAGFSSVIGSENPFTLYGYTGSNPISPEVSVFKWDPQKNSSPAIALDAHVYADSFVVGGDQTKFSNVNVFIVGYSYEQADFILASSAISGLSFWPVLTSFDLSVLNQIPLTISPKYCGVSDVQSVAFYFNFQNVAFANPTIPNTTGVAKVGVNFPAGFPPAVPKLSFYNTNLVGIQPEYIPPNSNTDEERGYEFGNPQAIAKCEELIHEFALILDKN